MNCAAVTVLYTAVLKARVVPVKLHGYFNCCNLTVSDALNYCKDAVHANDC